MSLRDAMNNVAKNFDAKNDSINEFKGLPSGNYTVAVTKVEDSTAPWGAEQLSFVLEVVEGEHAGSKEFLRIGLDEVTAKGNPNPMLETNIRIVMKLAAVLGTTIPDAAWDDDSMIYANLTKVFQETVGKTMTMHLNVRPNKKNPQYPYRNYDFDAVEQPATPEVSDDQMPF